MFCKNKTKNTVFTYVFCVLMVLESMELPKRPCNSFQNDLKIDNLIAKQSNDFDSDGVREVFWRTSDNSAYLRALMHEAGNIRYAN